MAEPRSWKGRIESITSNARTHRLHPGSGTPRAPGGGMAKRIRGLRALSIYGRVYRKSCAMRGNAMPESSLVRFENEGGIGVITCDTPPVNALSPGRPEGLLAGVD